MTHVGAIVQNGFWGWLRHEKSDIDRAYIRSFVFGVSKLFPQTNIDSKRIWGAGNH